MKILNLWKRRFRTKTDIETGMVTSTTAESGISHRRALEWLGKDLLERQRFYEHWVTRKDWLAHAEGLSILLGRDPEDDALADDIEFQEQRQNFWQHLQYCVEQRMPPAIANPEATSEAWRVAPVDLYRWAIMARVPVPQELDNLLSFVSSTHAISAVEVAEVQRGGKNPEAGDNQSLQREQALSIMLSLSLQAQHEAGGDSADTIRDRILLAMYIKSRQYFDSDEPPLSRPALHDLIDRSLETAGLIHLSR